MKRTFCTWSRYWRWILICGLLCGSLACVRAADNWLWAKSIGGMWSTCVGVDGAGNSYVLGEFAIGDLGNAQETVAGVSLQKQTNYSNGFLVKYDPSGNLGWVRQVGAESRAMQVDFKGSVYVSGYLTGKARIGTTEFQSPTNRQLIMVTRYDSAGEILWTRQVGEAQTASVNRVAVDSGGNYYVAGDFNGNASFGGSAGQIDFTLATRGSRDMFVVKCSANGAVQWVKTEGGLANDTVDDMVVSDGGDCYIVGHLGEISDSVIVGGKSIERRVGDARFLAKLNPQGDFEWVKEINTGGNNFFPFASIAIDQAANVYTVGVFQSSAKIEDSVLVSTNASDFYMVKFDPSGNVAWARTGGTCCDNDVRGIAVDKRGNLYVTGIFSFHAYQLNPQPQKISIVRKYSQFGELLGEEYGTGSVNGNAITIDSSGNLIIAGGLSLGGKLGQAQRSDNDTFGSDGVIAKLRPFVVAGIIRIQSMSPDEIHVSLQDFDAANYRIETSSDLLNWAPFLSWPGANGVFEFSDFPTPNTPTKFYRVVTLP